MNRRNFFAASAAAIAGAALPANEAFAVVMEPTVKARQKPWLGGEEWLWKLVATELDINGNTTKIYRFKNGRSAVNPGCLFCGEKNVRFLADGRKVSEYTTIECVYAK